MSIDLSQRFNRDRFMSLGKGAASEAAFKLNNSLQEMRPEEGLMALALNLRTMAEFCNVDLNDVLGAALRCQNEIDSHADEKRRADLMYKSWYAKDYGNDSAVGDLVMGRDQ